MLSGFYTQWLLLPAVVGFAVGLVQCLCSINSLITPLFALFVAFWGEFLKRPNLEATITYGIFITGTLYIEAWKRHEAELRCAWHVEGCEQKVFFVHFISYEIFIFANYCSLPKETYRTSYRGEKALNQITGDH